MIPNVRLWLFYDYDTYFCMNSEDLHDFYHFQVKVHDVKYMIIRACWIYVGSFTNDLTWFQLHNSYFIIIQLHNFNSISDESTHVCSFLWWSYEFLWTIVLKYGKHVLVMMMIMFWWWGRLKTLRMMLRWEVYAHYV